MPPSKLYNNTSSRDSFISIDTRQKTNSPQMSKPGASTGAHQIRTYFCLETSIVKEKKPKDEKVVIIHLSFIIIPRESCRSLGLSRDQLLFDSENKRFQETAEIQLCRTLGRSYAASSQTFFEKEIRTLKDFEMAIRFNPDIQSVFHKPSRVPITVQEDLDSALQTGVKRGNWEPTQFNSYGTLRLLGGNGRRCLQEKCLFFTQSYVEYLGQRLSKDLRKGPKAEAITQVSTPKNVSSLTSFLGQGRFYGWLKKIPAQMKPSYALCHLLAAITSTVTDNSAAPNPPRSAHGSLWHAENEAADTNCRLLAPHRY
ncbi:transposon tf2-6 polyprotein [Plakobranchus ocellatus]|uniref:Transposon tf2-6 polyprotein n=1 Tax=Plakobranchus ocellatus TaxID=259542 RepID=A0AAV3YX88_9GAST|nr:transposon tf2-6 polyprotein [Plakobranchus ocellatus]